MPFWFYFIKHQKCELENYSTLGQRFSGKFNSLLFKIIQPEHFGPVLNTLSTSH